MTPSTRKAASHFFGIVLAAVALCLIVAGIIFALIGEGTASLVPGVLAAFISLVAYGLGSRRLSTVTLILGVATIFFGVAASQGLIPGISQSDHEYPDNIPQQQSGPDEND